MVGVLWDASLVILLTTQFFQACQSVCIPLAELFEGVVPAACCRAGQYCIRQLALVERPVSADQLSFQVFRFGPVAQDNERRRCERDTSVLLMLRTSLRDFVCIADVQDVVFINSM